MDKKHIMILAIGIIIMVGIICLFGFRIITISTNTSRVVIWCEENNISENNCYVKTPECFYDCKSLGLEYFKLNVNTGFFQGIECYCEINGTSQKIW